MDFIIIKENISIINCRVYTGINMETYWLQNIINNKTVNDTKIANYGIWTKVLKLLTQNKRLIYITFFNTYGIKWRKRFVNGRIFQSHLPLPACKKYWKLYFQFKKTKRMTTLHDVFWTFFGSFITIVAFIYRSVLLQVKCYRTWSISDRNLIS